MTSGPTMMHHSHHPPTGTGWRVRATPASCPVNNLQFQVIVGADGKRNALGTITFDYILVEYWSKSTINDLRFKLKACRAW